MTTETDTKIAEFAKSVQAEIDGAERDVVRRIAEVRRQLDQLEAAIDGGFRVAGSVTGETFFAGSARDLARAVEDRQVAYDRLVLVENIEASLSS